MGETVQMGRRDFLRSIAATSAAVASPAPASTLVPTADREVLQGEIDEVPAQMFAGKMRVRAYLHSDSKSRISLNP